MAPVGRARGAHHPSPRPLSVTVSLTEPDSLRRIARTQLVFTARGFAASRNACSIASTQEPDGTWPRGAMTWMLFGRYFAASAVRSLPATGSSAWLVAEDPADRRFAFESRDHRVELRADIREARPTGLLSFTLGEQTIDRALRVARVGQWVEERDRRRARRRVEAEVCFLLERGSAFGDAFRREQWAEEHRVRCVRVGEVAVQAPVLDIRMRSL